MTADVGQDVLQRARRILREAPNVLVLTGAGISAESGVPTFRGTGEHWRNKHFTELACPEAFARDPREIWDWYLYRRGVVAKCQPNAAHRALADWAKSRKGVTLVTQNVDGLHEAAGHPNVVRFHGLLWLNRCTACGIEREDRSLEYSELPRSPCCDALERPAIVWFGEEIPDQARLQANCALANASAVLIVGTSGTVYPAASFANAARAQKTPVINVNPDISALSQDIAIRLPAGEAVPGMLL